jgi:hypothetical protein
MSDDKRLEEMEQRRFEEKMDYDEGVGAYPFNRERPSEKEFLQRPEAEVTTLKRQSEKEERLEELARAG